MKQNLSNYHTHTSLCHHAEGNIQDYYDNALKNGCVSLGFSDHCPISFEDDLWNQNRMSMDELSIYVETVDDLKNKSKMPVYLGFECEWDKAYKNWYEDVLCGECNADYLVLGLHWLVKGKSHLFMDFNDKKDFHSYIDQLIEAMTSGLFKFVAHPDIFMRNIIEWDADAESCSNAIIDAAVSLNLPLEINGNGLHRNKMNTSRGERFQYPYDEFWILAKEKNARVICNSDAHNPDSVITYAEDAIRYAEKLNINYLHDIFNQNNNENL